MLTGDELISWGDAFLMGRSVRSEVKEVHKQLGYCPQFDAVIGEARSGAPAVSVSGTILNLEWI